MVINTKRMINDEKKVFSSSPVQEIAWLRDT
jgi:hypothetical protein